MLEVDVDEMFNQLEAFQKEESRANETTAVPRGQAVCDECGEIDLYHDKTHGTVVCVGCGTIREDSFIDDSPEWIFTAADAQYGKDPSRCGCPINPFFERSSMSTKIVGGNKNSLMQKIHSQMSMDYTERARWHMFERIQQMAGNNVSPSAIEIAKSYYIKICAKKLSRGDIRKGLVACCIMYACKSQGNCRSVKETAAMFCLEPSVVTKAAKIFEFYMKDEINNSKRTSVDDLVNRFVNCIGVPFNRQFTIVKRVNLLHFQLAATAVLQGKTPSAITSALIFIVCNELEIKVSKVTLSENHKISQVTLNKLIALIQPQLNLNDT